MTFGMISNPGAIRRLDSTYRLRSGWQNASLHLSHALRSCWRKKQVRRFATSQKPSAEKKGGKCMKMCWSQGQTERPGIASQTVESEVQEIFISKGHQNQQMMQIIQIMQLQALDAKGE